MRILYKAVNLSNDSKKQVLIQELIKMGVTKFRGKSIDSLDYYEARHALALERAKRG
ncbi:hypothetical protein [Fervidibacillus albus]|uniref:Uncharacterized protein n=1 Tax=Fervidibacillus albus TaxID=2980026 RepID=A0A9E8LVN4_9BACI|nr:hypothetical protein [Fervidibacillus albus]WAA10312.1 hypothetical protein OE104_02965 [Fervidibacillus albus]